MLEARGAGTLTLSQARYGDSVMTNKHWLMLVSCSR